MKNHKNGYYIFRAWITNQKTGQRIYAKDKGKKAFPIWIEYRK